MLIRSLSNKATLLGVLLTGNFLLSTALAQSAAGDLGEEVLDVAEELDEATTDRNGSFVAVPIPFSNPLIGTGLAAVAAYMYRLDPEDEETPASFTGAGGFFSDSDSWGAGLAQRFYLREDRERVLIGAATTEINYDFFGIGSDAGEEGLSIPLKQEGDAVSVTFEHRVVGDIFVGIRLAAADITTSLDFNIDLDIGVPAPFLGFELEAKHRIEDVGLLFRFDHRNHVYNPTDGSLANLNISSRKISGGLRSPRRYAKYAADYNHYIPVENAVLAYRVSACYAGSGAPFYDVCSFGADSDLRGYTTGRYRDRSQLTAQLEYRRPISERWSWAAFAGVGTVAPTFSDMNSDDLLPAVGGGVRFIVSEAQRISLRVDVARGADESTLHISVGEAF